MKMEPLMTKVQDDNNKTPLMVKMTEKERQDAINKRKLQDGDLYKYLVLLEGEYIDSDGENYKSYEIIKGRQATYDFIKDLLESQNTGISEYIVDVSKSKIIVEPPVITPETPRITLSNMLSVYAFMKAMKEKGRIVDESSFDIEEYYDGYIEDEE